MSLIQQIGFFKKDLKRMLGVRKSRILYIWLTPAFAGILTYRIDRGLYLTLGKYYGILRVPLMPIFNLFRAYANMELHYKSDIKGGLHILHPSGGVTTSRFVKIGENLTLVGGNFIAGKNEDVKTKDFIIGDNCYMGANSVVLGPLVLADNIKIGASACVVKDHLVNDTVLVGVPAKPLESHRYDIYN